MSKVAEVVTLYEKNARDIPAMLRESADSIERDQHVLSMTAVAIHDDGSVSIYGWGTTDNLHSIAALNLGLAKLTRLALVGPE